MDFSRQAAETGKPTYGYQINGQGNSLNDYAVSGRIGGGIPVMNGTDPNWSLGVGAAVSGSRMVNNSQSFPSKPNYEAGVTLHFPLGGPK